MLLAVRGVRQVAEVIAVLEAEVVQLLPPPLRGREPQTNPLDCFLIVSVWRLTPLHMSGTGVRVKLGEGFAEFKGCVAGVAAGATEGALNGRRSKVRNDRGKGGRRDSMKAMAESSGSLNPKP